MLVLTRRRQESIKIDGPCVIHILEVRGKIARVGIEAAREVPIVRSGAKSGPKPKPAEEPKAA